MFDTFVDICIRLALKAFNYGLLLIKLPLMHQALKFELSEFLLDLSKWKLYSIELRTVWHNQYPHDTQLLHLFFYRCRLVSSYIVHHDS